MLLSPHHTELGRDEGRVCNYRISGTDGVLLTIATIRLLDLDQTLPRLKALIARC
jgi:hypothetical protein